MKAFLVYVGRALAISASTLGWCLRAIYLALTGQSERVVELIGPWSRQLVGIAGVKLEVRGLETPLAEPAYLFLCTHSSHFDVPCLYAVAPYLMRPVAKKELTRVPIFGWVLKNGASVVIDRKQRSEAEASLTEAGRIIAGGVSVLMFPEGTRTPAGQVSELKSGPFHLAMAAGVPIVPVAVNGSAEVLPVGDWRIRSRAVQVCFGEPIPVKGRASDRDSRRALMAEVHEALSALVAEDRASARECA